MKKTIGIILITLLYSCGTSKKCPPMERKDNYRYKAESRYDKLFQEADSAFTAEYGI